MHGSVTWALVRARETMQPGNLPKGSPRNPKSDRFVTAAQALWELSA